MSIHKIYLKLFHVKQMFKLNNFIFSKFQINKLNVIKKLIFDNYK